MGLAIKDLVVSEEIELKDLGSKKLAIDTFNMLYQFLTTIRARDGSLLTDSKGAVTSHLIGLFSRITNFLNNGLKPVFVFDGEPPKLKMQERQRRAKIKAEAKQEYEIAKQREDIELMRKFASRTTKLTSDMIADAKELIALFGLPIVQAKSEGEAQAAFLVRRGDCYATISQDFDTLLHGSTRLVRNLSIAGKRKKTNKLGYITVKPELITLTDNFNHLAIDTEQLIALAMLVGTDYNIGGIKGIGPKKALTLVKQYQGNLKGLFGFVKWDDFFPYSWEDVFYLIKDMPVSEDYTINFTSIDRQGIMEFLCDKHEFDTERVTRTLDKLTKAQDNQQKGLGEFF